MLEYNKDLALIELLKYPIEEIMLHEWYYDIPGYEGFYQCSNFGKVYGVKRGYLLRARFNKNLKRYVLQLNKDGIPNTYTIGRLVLQTFSIEKPLNKNWVLHKNGDSTNDRLDNLYWGSHEDNEKDKLVLNEILKGEQHPNSKLTTNQILEIRRLRKETNLSFIRIGYLFNISRTHARYICCNKTWKHLKEV